MPRWHPGESPRRLPTTPRPSSGIPETGIKGPDREMEGGGSGQKRRRSRPRSERGQGASPLHGRLQFCPLHQRGPSELVGTTSAGKRLSVARPPLPTGVFPAEPSRQGLQLSTAPEKGAGPSLRLANRGSKRRQGCSLKLIYLRASSSILQPWTAPGWLDAF